MLEEMTQVGQSAAKLAAAPLWSLSDSDLTACLTVAHRLGQTAAALQARLVRQVGERGLPAEQGHRGVAGWLRARLLLDHGPARELADRAAALARCPAVEQALVDGRIDARQATVIADTAEAVGDGLAELDDATLAGPADESVSDPAGGSSAESAVGAAVDDTGSGPEVADEIVGRATSTLIEMAGRLSACQLRRVGERILTHVAPHVAERVEEAALARQAQRAHRARGVTLSAPVAGLARLSGHLSVQDAAIVQAALHPWCTPAPGDKRSPAQRRADGLIEVCRLALRTGELPDSGGEPAQVAVTVAFDPLTQALGAAVTDSGLRLPAATVRRLACDAKILPVILGGAGQVLDLGRARRLASGGLRRALAIRDGGCAWPDGDRPPRWTDAHHVIPWTAGGPTGLDNLVLLCRRHHRLIQHPTAVWQIRFGEDRLPVFIPPPDVDPHRHPRRNLYHPRRI